MEGPREQVGFSGSTGHHGGKGPELAGAVSPQLWLTSGHTLAEGLLADPLIEGITVVVIPLLLNVYTIFILPIHVLPVVWLIIVPKPGKKKAR